MHLVLSHKRNGSINKISITAEILMRFLPKGMQGSFTAQNSGYNTGSIQKGFPVSTIVVWFLPQTLIHLIALKDLNYFILDLFSRAPRRCICDCPSSFLPCPKLSRLQNIYKSWKDMGIYDCLQEERTCQGYRLEITSLSWAS